MKESNLRYLSVAALFFLLGGLFYAVTQWKTRNARDFYQFWVVGQAISSMDLSNIYREEERASIRKEFYKRALESRQSRHELRTIFHRRVLDLAGTPFLYSAFYLFSQGNFDKDYILYKNLSLVLFVVGVFSLCWILKYSPLYASVTSLTFLFLFYPLRLDIRMANINQIQFSLLSISLLLIYISEKPLFRMLSGLILGLAVLLKPILLLIPVLLIIHWLISRRFETLFYSGLGFFAAVGLGILLPHLTLGEECTWSNWQEGFQSIVFNSRYSQKNLFGTLSNSASMKKHFIMGGVLSFIPIGIFIRNKSGLVSRFVDLRAETLRKEKYFLEDYQTFGFGILIYLLSGPLVHGHYFLLTAPIIIFLLRPNSGGAPSLLYLQKSVGILSFLFISSHTFLGGFNIISNSAFFIFGYLGVFILFIACVVHLYERENRWF